MLDFPAVFDDTGGLEDVYRSCLILLKSMEAVALYHEEFVIALGRSGLFGYNQGGS